MKLEIAKLDELPRDRGVRVKIGEERIAMFRIGEDVYAIGDRCSHAEASLAERPVDSVLEPAFGTADDL